MNIIEKLGITPGDLRVRKTTDDSGDYTYHQYDILACYEWGCSGIVYDMDNPNNARLFACSPEMLEALIDSVIMLEEVFERWCNVDGDKRPMWYNSKTAIIEKATGKTWEEVRKLLSEAE